MMKIEWRDAWINTLIDAGYKSITAREKFQEIYGYDGPDTAMNPAHQARAAIDKLKADAGRNESIGSTPNV